jgi:hypothetical protein
MDFTEQLYTFDILGGQQAPRASDGIGFRILYQCRVCERVWLRDGKTDLLDMNPEQIHQMALELSANLAHLPRVTCRPCLWRTGGGSVEIDQYGSGEGFGFYWEIPRPVILHASSAILSEQCVRTKETVPELLTRQEILRSMLQTVKDIPFPLHMEELPDAYCQLQTLEFRPGFGQTGTERWQWRGWIFFLECPPLDGQATITFLLALPPSIYLSKPTAFAVWQFLLEVTLLGGIPEGR